MRRTTRSLLTAVTVCLLTTAGTGVATAGVSHAQRLRPARHIAGLTFAPGYLALGDSVAFGYREATNPPTPDYTKAASFVGYPEDVAADLGLPVANAACPGETSSSLLDASAASNGCENSPGGGGGYRTGYPLHVSYSGSQLSYAVGYLRAHPNTRLVSLMIGANDLFLCENSTTDGCSSELPSVLATVKANVTTLLSAVRSQGGYRGTIVIVDYYSLDYADATDNQTSQGLNQAMDSAASPFGAKIADGYGAFETAAAQSDGDSCAAGLLTVQTTGGCGVHPSPAGHTVLAGAVETALGS